ncbi:MAG: shikimate dehydrogenase [Candidatus Azobacteroides sp.]|nr:shikimate dehydrogenase [Candidatus Azobacteroides sp.]
MSDKYGLIGYPLTHSFSKGYFNEKFQSEKLDAEYINFEIPNIGEFKALVASNPDLKGLNVTIPYKEQVIKYLDDLDEAVKEIGAVNVIKFIRTKNGLKLKGYNSDYGGFYDSISPEINDKHKKALILGTGGASKAVVYALNKLGVECVFVSRKPGKGELAYTDLDEKIMKEYTVIINTTPVGMYPKVDDAPDIPYECLTPDHFLYDLLYNPDVTKFMRLGKEHGAEIKNGLEMLLLQAFISWQIWQSQ